MRLQSYLKGTDMFQQLEAARCSVFGPTRYLDAWSDSRRCKDAFFSLPENPLPLVIDELLEASSAADWAQATWCQLW